MFLTAAEPTNGWQLQIFKWWVVTDFYVYKDICRITCWITVADIIIILDGCRVNTYGLLQDYMLDLIL